MIRENETCLITETLNIHAWRDKLKTTRAVYHELRKTPEMVVPWWLLESDSEFFDEMVPRKEGRVSREPQRLGRIRNVKDDPLSSAEDKVSSEKCNGQVGYKQGIHEILGLIYKNILSESLEISNTNTFSLSDLEVLSLYDIKYLEHDLFFLFNKFVVGSGIISSFYQSEASLIKSIEQFNGVLMKVDQLIHYNLITKLKLDSQLWLIRFFRLLLLRELGNNLEVPSYYWDKLAAAEASTPTGVQILPELVSFSLKGDDLKLYEYGIKLNRKYASVIKISLKEGSSEKLGSMEPPKNRIEIPAASDTRKANMAFEKSRLELRLKKRAQSVLKKRET
ncbi:hypothetical protein JCM33374_g579 [Metschnikowia sp. JCM 33374]|nr:hypothetical protein JCM33374_g579 [Metschnikowia sp. JCM 33374]